MEEEVSILCTYNHERRDLSEFCFMLLPTDYDIVRKRLGFPTTNKITISFDEPYKNIADYIKVNNKKIENIILFGLESFGMIKFKYKIVN